ncbi:hypothetical protein RHMOL_Rhmol05G0078900 [Rhododendron molle]|uniref:Uncharacterized protein n=1 Tax=Rhododendron molle TaxID=49168 RepID=A0ACC0NMS4_RHOML|nr:hypothetical protein RHMOL_Rhmol05G0078900 [Rhododendron molle]
MVFVLVVPVVLCLVLGWFSASDHWSARRGFGAALDCQRCPSVARTPRASGSLLFGVASSPAKENLFEILLRCFAGDLTFGLLYWGRQISLCCIDHFD